MKNKKLIITGVVIVVLLLAMVIGYERHVVCCWKEI